MSLSTAAFFEALYGGAGGCYMAIWEMPGKRTAWFPVPEGLEPAAQAALSLSAEGRDVYFGLGLQPDDLGPSQRGSAATVAAIPALWADIDVAGPAHTKPNLPPDGEAVFELLGEMPLAPTMVVNSGHGIHAYWLFHEPWEFGSGPSGAGSERDEAAWMLRGWQNLLRRAAAKRGWDVDSTSDLSRVLRVPGTLNMKSEPHELVTVTQQSGPMFARDEIEVHLAGYGTELSQVVPAKLEGWAPPKSLPMRLQLVLDADDKLRAAWRHQRPDLSDQSLSGYDASIASLAAHNGLSEEDIATLITHHRYAWGDERDMAKGARLDYISRTVGWARRAREVESAVASGEVLERDDRATLALRLWEEVGVTGITAWYVVLGTDNEFVLGTPRGEVRLTSNQFSMYNQARNRIATHLGQELVAMKQAGWISHVSRLRAVAEERGEMDQPVELIASWISEYQKAYQQVEEMDQRKDGLDSGGWVLLRDGSVALRGQKLLRWVQTQTGFDKMGMGELRALWMRAGGKTSHPVAVEGSAVSCWVIQL